MSKNGKATWGPDRIRSLRGEQSRAEFAAKVGVSALTVYRWELPDDAPEARRPRGTIAKRLEALFGSAEPATVGSHPAALVTTPAASSRPEPGMPTPVAPSADELRDLLPVGERLLQGELGRVEAELLALFASGQLRSVAARAYATQLLSRYQLWARGDSLGAFATLLPVLQQANDGVLVPEVELEVHVTAALVFASLDGRVFDAGKTNAHIARAERLPIAKSDAQRFLLWIAQLLAAYILNDPPLIELVLARRDEVDQHHASRLLQCFAVEAKLLLHYFARQPQAVAGEFARLLDLAAHFPVFHARALAQAARNQIDEAALPDAVLATAERVHAVCRDASIGIGVHDLYTAYAAGDALWRMGRIADAEKAWRHGIRVCEELRWSPGTLPFFIARLLFLTGRAREVRGIAARVEQMSVTLYPGLWQGLRKAITALAELGEGAEPSACVDHFHDGVRSLDEHNVWSFLRRSMAVATVAVAVFVGDTDQIERALRHADMVLDAAPAHWAHVAVRALRGAAALRAGRHLEARPLLEGALAALEVAGDRMSCALVRRWLALIAVDLDDAGAGELLEASTEELAHLGLVAHELLDRRRPPRAETTLASGGALLPLAAGVQRLCAHVSSPELVYRELVTVVRELVPGARVRLCEVDARGTARTLHADDAQSGGETIAIPTPSARLQLTVRADAWTDAHARVLAAIASVAGLAIETAALRGISARTGTPSTPDAAPELPGFIASSPAMRKLKLELARLAKSRSTIIITGESGAGKEVVARALHDLSIRAHRPYVAFNCAAIPRELFEGQLFGYRKGAFTGATSDHPGVIRAADGGTLFLDEIGELPLEVQPKLLRFLENSEIFPLGEQRPQRVDVRVIAATFRELDRLVREGRFREDLYYRLQVVPIHVPPLRERPDDIISLARFFVEKLTPADRQPPVLAPGALLALTSHAWPGNVRELRNVIERSLAFEPLPSVLEADHLRIR